MSVKKIKIREKEWTDGFHNILHNLESDWWTEDRIYQGTKDKEDSIIGQKEKIEIWAANIG